MPINLYHIITVIFTLSLYAAYTSDNRQTIERGYWSLGHFVEKPSYV